ncbi:MAG: ATP-binding protein [Succinivibrio dextrinosolvens]|nr:ATP-binding protein [Succinivibrio dextrinosolvens]
MITIKKIEIKDYFGRGNFEWNLDPVVNILGGKNGSGKSTLFKLCYALLVNDKIDSKTDKQFSALFEKVTLTLSNDWTIVWVKPELRNEYLLELGGSVPQQYRDIIFLNHKGELQEQSKRKEFVNVFMINSFEQKIVSLINRIQDQKHLLGAGVEATLLDSLIDKEINLRNRNLSAAVDKYMDESVDDITALNLFKRKHNMINVSLHNFMTEYEKKISSDFVFSKKGEKIAWQSLSMGEKQILLLLLMVSNTQQQPCIFFMDEPDLSMHIDWKEILVKELHELNPNMQIILSTHAPSVITGWHDKVKEVNQLIKK